MMLLFTNPIVLLALTVTSVRASPIVCFQDNPSRALNRFSKEAASFCPKYLAGSSATPYWVAEFSAPQISSACSCYESKTGLHPVTPTPTPSQKPATTSVQISKKPTLSSKKPTVVSHVPSSTNAATPKATSKTLAATSTSTKASIKPLATPIVPKSTNTNVGKRGLLYDYTSSDYSKFYKGSNKVTFGSDWHATRGETGATLDSTMAFIPTLTVDKRSLLNPTWLTTITGLIAGGVDIVFASNEPDNAGQADLTPAQAAQVYKQYMMPLKVLGARLCTPAITNGDGNTGLNYLEQFVGECEGCSFDIINIHHYVQRSDLSVDQAVATVKTYIETKLAAVQEKHAQLKGLKIFLGEFWLWGASESESAEYMRKILPYLDGNDQIIGYQAFGGLFKGNFINADGTGLTPAGAVYRDL